MALLVQMSTNARLGKTIVTPTRLAPTPMVRTLAPATLGLPAMVFLVMRSTNAMATMIARPMEDALIPMGHIIVHATKATTAMARSAQMSMSAQPLSVVQRVHTNVPLMQIASTPLDLTIARVKPATKVMAHFAQISMNVPVTRVLQTPGAPTLRLHTHVLAMLVTVALVLAALT
jgi:hypothetical protein